MVRLGFVIGLALLSAHVWAMDEAELAVSRCRQALIRMRLTRAFADLKQQNLADSESRDNGPFIEFANQPPPKDALFFHVENAVLKSLNDKVLGDKEASAALQALYAKIFREELAKEGVAAPTHSYSDYKSIRLAFAKDSPQVRAALERVAQRSADRFSTEVEKFPALLERVGAETGLVSDVRRWNLSGMGGSADQAAHVSRLARYEPPDSSGRISVGHFDLPTVQRRFSERFSSVEDLRTQLVAELEKGGDPFRPLLVRTTTGAGKKILSPEAIELLRKVSAVDRDSYVKEVQERFDSRFGVKLSVEQVELLQKYFHAVDAFAPSIFEAKDVKDLGLSVATDGVITVDLAGQNVRNLHRMMESLAVAAETYRSGDIPKVIERLRVGQNIASNEFFEKRAAVLKAIESLGIQGEVRFSGDDVVFAPKRFLSDSERGALLAKLHTAIGGGTFRMSHVASHYHDTGNRVPSEKISGLTAKAEAMEKRLRERLERNGFGYEKLKKLSFSVEFVPGENESPRIVVRVRPELVDSEITRLKDLLPGVEFLK